MAAARDKKGAQLEIVTPRPQLLVMEPLEWDEHAPPTDNGRMAHTEDDRGQCATCVGTHGRSSADRSGAPFLQNGRGAIDPCWSTSRSSHDWTGLGLSLKARTPLNGPHRQMDTSDSRPLAQKAAAK